MKDVFEKYLAYRYQRSGAVTPGQKLEALRELRAEAQRGSVPIDERSIVSLDTGDPSVGAVLRGESVSIGLGAPLKRKKVVPLVGDWKKYASLAAILLVPTLLASLALGLRNRGVRAKALAITQTAAALATQASMPTNTLEVPTPTLVVATSTPDSVLYASVPGEPGQGPTDPASIELGGRLFILQQGVVNRETGLWNPTQPEWLEETVLRKVFALPRAFLENAGITPGEHALVRLRDGELVDYIIQTVLRLPLNQIEVLTSNRPSLVVLTIDESKGQAPQVERLVLVGEVPVPVQPEDLGQVRSLNGLVRDSGTGAVRLRATPSLSGDVIELLPPDTLVSIAYPPQRADGDGLSWVYVQSALGSGWLAEDLILYRP